MLSSVAWKKSNSYSSSKKVTPPSKKRQRTASSWLLGFAFCCPVTLKWQPEDFLVLSPQFTYGALHSYAGWNNVLSLIFIHIFFQENRATKDILHPIKVLCLWIVSCLSHTVFFYLCICVGFLNAKQIWNFMTQISLANSKKVFGLLLVLKSCFDFLSSLLQKIGKHICCGRFVFRIQDHLTFPFFLFLSW